MVAGVMTSTAAVRRAGLQDAVAILPLAKRFVDRSPYAQYVTYDEEQARAALLQALSHGAVYVLETEDGRIVGAIMGMMVPWWFSKDVVAAEMGWWVNEDARGQGDALRQRFEQWARDMRAPVVSMSDVILDDTTPAGALYERKGYELVERAWLKGLRGQN
jgi:GNAT superfamily N-acetyltransferase